MPFAQAEKILPNPHASAVCFVTASRLGELSSELLGQRVLVAAVEFVARGSLRKAIDAALERALTERGALPPAIDGDPPLETVIKDQVFRARALGASGIAILLPSLLAGDGSPLDAADSSAFSAWIGAAKRSSVSLVLHDANRDLYLLTPTPLTNVLGSESPHGEPSSGLGLADEISAPPPPVLTMPRRGQMKKVSRIPAPLPEALPEAMAHADAPADEAPHEAPAEDRHGPPAEDRQAAPARNVSSVARTADSGLRPVDSAAAHRVVNAAEWRSHALELDKARGPKPVSAIDRLFRSRYVPLLGAVARGAADQTIKNVVEAWRSTFEHSYREAFSALRVTGKRPPMVFDAPDLAGRIGRLNGARATKLFLVDSLRFDLGERIADRLQERLAGRAVCIEKALLWAALPTSTPTQLALLGRGADGLRESEPEGRDDGEILRGRAVSTVRRERVGSREIMKLDVLEARLRTPGPAYDERLDALADEVAPIVVKFVETLAPRTLLFLFGDHGFRLPSSADGQGTGPATQGGCSPEEVLVPGQAWLVGGVH